MINPAQINPIREFETLSGDRFISSSGGSDTNDGLSSSSPWQTLTHASQFAYVPGTKVQLKRGDTWQETFVPHGHGDRAGGIWNELTAYGSGADPILDGNGHNIDCGVKFQRDEDNGGWKFSNIDFQNYKIAGIDAERSASTNRDGLWITNCDFTSITGALVTNVSTKELSRLRNVGYDMNFAHGIFVEITDHLTIDHCTFSALDCPFGILAGSTILVDTITCDNVNYEGPTFIPVIFGAGYYNVPESSSGVGGSDVTLQNFTFSNIGNGAGQGMFWGTAGLTFYGWTNVTVQDGEIFNVGNAVYGIDMIAIDLEGSNVTKHIRRVNMHDCNGSAFLVNQAQAFSPARNESGTTIDDCIFNNNGLAATNTIPAMLRCGPIPTDNMVITNNTITRANPANQELFANTVGGGQTNTPQGNWTFPIAPAPNGNTITN